MKCKNHVSRALILIGLLCLNSLLSYSQSITVKFSVDMSLLISQNLFNPATDQVRIKGSFNNWGDQNGLIREGTTTVYSTTLSLNRNSYFEYKFFNTRPGAENGGWETKPGFADGGNRTLNTGTNNLVLPTVFYNNGDLALNLTTTHFIFYCTQQDIGVLNAFSTRLETEYDRIVGYLETAITQKIEVYIYKNEVYYHNAIGYPEFPDWAVGSAFGKTIIQMASPNHAGSHSYNDMLKIIVHEFAHITEAWKATASLPIWLNEGVATWLGGQIPLRSEIVNKINSLGRKPELAYFEDLNTFSNNSGYAFAYTIAEFMDKTHGSSKVAGFVGNVSYTGLGYADKNAFQTAWHKFLADYYVNATPPVITVSNVRRFGDNWTISYSPHPATDGDGNPISYIFTLTSEGFNKTYTDTNHSGSFNIPRRDLAFNTTYTIASKTYDGIVYIPSVSTKVFTTTNTLPLTLTFSNPANGQIIQYNSDHQYRVTWGPAQILDADGDYVTDKVTIKGYGVNKTFSSLGDKCYALLDSADFEPGRVYTITGERLDGFDTVKADSLTFMTPGTNGVPDSEFTRGSARIISLYPNPVQNIATLRFTLPEPGWINIKITDPTGRLVYSEKRSFIETGTQIHRLDLDTLGQGIYILTVESRTGTSVTTITKS